MECVKCGKSFSRIDNLKRHQRSAKACVNREAKRPRLDVAASTLPIGTVRCNACELDINKACYSAHLKTHVHKKNAFVIIDDGVERIAGAFGDKIVSYRITEPGFFTDVDEFLDRICEKVLNLITSCIDLHQSVKLNMECFAIYSSPNREQTEIKSFNTKNKVVTQVTDLYRTFDSFQAEMHTKMSEFQERDSGWALVRILYLEVNLHRFNPMRASSYLDLPASIKAKHAIINVQNNDNACFAWAIMSALHQPDGLPQRMSSHPHYSDTGLKFDNLEFPLKLRDVPKFEERNDISVNVYGIRSYFNGRTTVDDIITLHICKRKLERHVNLLLISNDEGHNHYCWIKNLSRLVSSQTSNNGHQRFICDGCLLFFSCERKLERHQLEDCNMLRTRLPSTDIKINKYGFAEKENVLQFENFEKQFKLPFVVYADFEALLKPVESRSEGFPDATKSFTVKCYEHEPYAFAYYIKCAYDNELCKFEMYRGPNAAVEFISRLEKDVVGIYQRHLSRTKVMNKLSTVEEYQHLLSDICHICEKRIISPFDKVRDHDHLTGQYRGPAHSVCNLNYQTPKFIPIIFHNLSNYDSHMFVKNIALMEEDVDVIAQNKEKYISFSKKIQVGTTVDGKGRPRRIFMKMRFIDSFRFMSCSLEKLGSFLDDNQCEEIKKRFTDSARFRLIRQKGVFPYSFVDSFDKLNYTSLPQRAEFFDLLTNEDVSEENYTRAQEVWRAFGCQTLGDYSDVYLTSDVLLLTDVFENFRNLSLDNYRLDPCWYFTAPGFGWDALLRMTGVKLELLTDVDMLMFFKKGIRGGLSVCSTRSAAANNEFMPDYDASKPSSYILYLDATNLYGYAMRCRVPTGSFRWLTLNEIERFEVNRVCENSELGYVLEVDLHYPPAVHDDHNDYPFCAENVKSPGSKSSKLMATLKDKVKYIIHYENLKQCLKHGLQLTCIHRVLEFQQSDWMRPYVDFNSYKRELAKNEFEKNHYKAMNNIVFGKTMENVENRVDIRLVTHWDSRRKVAGVEALVAQPNFKSSKIFCDNLVAIEMRIVDVLYNKPLYVGFAILELSKTVMYNFFYNFVKEKYANDALLLYTDTDSMILAIKTLNVYEDIKNNHNWFDTSNYNVNNVHGIPRGRQVLGNMKDEFPNDIITNFYGTGAKAYCVKLLNDSVKKAKGVKKCVIQNDLSVADYKRVVEHGGSVFKQMYVFRSDYHTVYTELKNKIALTANDDKRYILPDGLHTLAWGHKNLKIIEDVDQQGVTGNGELEVNSRLDNLLCLLNENLAEPRTSDM